MANLHVKWVNGNQVYYAGVQDILTIKKDDGGIVLGADTKGVDVKLFGNTTGKYFLWDESANKLIIVGAGADLGDACEADAYTVGGTAGIDESGSSTITTFSITVVKGIITAFSKLS